MALTASIAAVGAIASTAGSVISARNQKKAAENARDQQISGINDLRRVRERLTREALEGSFLDQYSSSDIFGRRPEEVNLDDSIRRAAILNEGSVRANRGLAELVNTEISQEAARRAGILDPNFRQNVSALSDSARSYLRGEIPDDVIESISIARAEGAAGGIGVPGAQRNATARDLGLTSLDLQARGTSLFQQINAARESIDPVSRQVSLNQFLLSPEQQIQTDIANRAIRASPDPAAQQLFNLDFSGSREEAFAKSSVTPPPVDNSLGVGLQAGGGALSSLAGYFGGSSGGNFSGYDASKAYNPYIPVVQARPVNR